MLCTQRKKRTSLCPDSSHPCNNPGLPAASRRAASFPLGQSLASPSRRLSEAAADPAAFRVCRSPSLPGSKDRFCPHSYCVYPRWRAKTAAPRPPLRPRTPCPADGPAPRSIPKLAPQRSALLAGVTIAPDMTGGSLELEPLLGGQRTRCCRCANLPSGDGSCPPADTDPA